MFQNFNALATVDDDSLGVHSGSDDMELYICYYAQSVRTQCKIQWIFGEFELQR